MSDLPARLRESIRACRALDRSQLLEEAAAEIERLRERNDSLAASLILKDMRLRRLEVRLGERLA